MTGRQRGPDPALDGGLVATQERSRGRAAIAALILGVLAIAVLVTNVPGFLGPYGGLAVILVGVPYGLVAVSAIAVGLALRSGVRAARQLAIAWAAVVAFVSGYWLLSEWLPLMSHVGATDTWMNIWQLATWVTIPFFVGAVYVLLELIRPRRAVVGLAGTALAIVALAIAATAVGWATRGQGPEPAPVEPGVGVPADPNETVEPEPLPEPTP